MVSLSLDSDFSPFYDPKRVVLFTLCFWRGSKVGPRAVQLQALRISDRHADIRDQREILGKRGPHLLLNP